MEKDPYYNKITMMLLEYSLGKPLEDAMASRLHNILSHDLADKDPEHEEPSNGSDSG